MEVADLIKLITEQGGLIGMLAWFMFTMNKSIKEMTQALERNTTAITQLVSQYPPKQVTGVGSQVSVLGAS